MDFEMTQSSHFFTICEPFTLQIWVPPGYECLKILTKKAKKSLVGQNFSFWAKNAKIFKNKK